MTDTVMISLADALRKLRNAAQNIDDGAYFDKEPSRVSLVMLREGIESATAALARYAVYEAGGESSPSPPSGLREALEKIRSAASGSGDFYVWWGNEKRAESSRQYIVEICTAALASPASTSSAQAGDWVKVDESHPLPDDLKIGDEVRSDFIGTIKRLPLDRSSPKHITAYRRGPPAEQGG